MAEWNQPVLIATGNQISFNLFLASSTLGISSWGAFVLGAEEKPPTQANLSRFPNPKFNDCPPPMKVPLWHDFHYFSERDISFQ